jgi:hypothetical protein
MASRRTTGEHLSNHAIGVMFEQLQSQMAVVLEAVTSTGQSLRAEMAACEARLSARIAVLEQVVRQSSEDIRRNSEEIRKNSEDIRALRDEVASLRAELTQLRHDFDHREERGRIDALERRVAALETRLGVT